MQSWSRVRVAKCQLLVASSFVLLLGLSMAATAAVNYLGTHFAVVGRASSDRTPYEATRRWAFCTSISLAGLLTLGAVLGAVATVREAGGLMAGGFLCFALAFCILVQVAFWRFHNPAQVEDAVLDTYDLVYDQAVRGSSITLRQQLVAIQDTDCLVGVRSFLRTYGNIASTLTGIGLASTVYAVLLSSFLWFAFRSGCSLDRRGKYTLSRRARDCRPQEPSFFRRSPGGSALQHPMEADVLDGRLRASRPSGGPQFLQDS
ncbi:tetraspanin-32 isoform X2 [Acinonyx jubatus]|uniref:Tetraspanin-32 isoform X2 n=1 Tax=Acinonyx jubatus TaxID=32536 RepID=A0A6J1Y8E0_ACIJB|nr:tetraspanin-32 isoform X2 [Acinonyx jubatus]